VHSTNSSISYYTGTVSPHRLTDLFVSFCFVLVLVHQPPVGHGLLIHEVSRSHTTTHHIWEDSSGRVISSSQRPLPDNTRQSQQTNIHSPGGIRTQNLSRRAAADLRLRLRGHWDRQPTYLSNRNKYCFRRATNRSSCTDTILHLATGINLR